MGARHAGCLLGPARIKRFQSGRDFGALNGDFTPKVSAGVNDRTLRQPLGVVAGITPFNLSAMVPTSGGER